MAAIDGDLLERLNQPSGALEIHDELVCRVATTVSELGEQGTAHWARDDLVGEVRAAVRERRGHRKADADRTIDLVCNPCDETTECGESLGFDEIALCFAGVQRQSRGIGLVEHDGAGSGRSGPGRWVTSDSPALAPKPGSKAFRPRIVQ